MSDRRKITDPFGIIDEIRRGNHGLPAWYIEETFALKGSGGTPGPQGPQGEPGADSTVPGPTGPAGPQGNPGSGVAVGGVAGQILSKIDGTDFNTEWIDKDAAGAFFPIDASEKMTGALRIQGVGESMVVLLNDLGQEQGKLVINKSTGQVSVERLNPVNGEIMSKLMLGSKAVSMAGHLGGDPEILNDHDLVTKSYVDSIVPPPAEEKPDQGLVTIEMDIAGLVPTKASCVAAAAMIPNYIWGKNHTFIIIDTFGFIRPTYMVQYVANGATDPSSAAYDFYITMLAKAQ